MAILSVLKKEHSDNYLPVVDDQLKEVHEHFELFHAETAVIYTRKANMKSLSNYWQF